MKNTVEFLDAVKKKHGLTSDYQLAGKLGLSRAAISRFQQGKDFLGDETAIKVADLLDLDPSYVAACIHSERAKQPAVKAMWKHTAEMLYGLAAVLALVAITPFALDNLPALLDSSQANIGLGFAGFVSQPGIYIMRISELPGWTLWILLSLFALVALPHRKPKT